MRGKEPLAAWVLKSLGITPAYAGKSGSLTLRIASNRDHPRVCGEKLYIMFMVAQKSGSPPRMRGKALDTLRSSPFTRDHPRVCGEKYQIKERRVGAEGSPPRMRGKAGCQLH